MFRHAQNYDTISWTGRLRATHQGDVLILIGHEKESPIVQDHTVHMLQGDGGVRGEERSGHLLWFF